MKKSMVVVYMMLVVSWSASASNTGGCVKTNKTEIRHLFDRWNDSLQSGNAKRVTDNYLSDAILLPTISSKVHLTQAERTEYFKMFLMKKPIGKIDSSHINLTCNSAIDTGTYTFTFADKSVVSARYTFVYLWDGKEWKIASHHSSVTP